MLPLVPTTMIVLLLSTSITATDTLLNGVAIAFVMEMDVRRPLLWIEAPCRPTPNLIPLTPSKPRRRRTLPSLSVCPTPRR